MYVSVYVCVCLTMVYRVLRRTVMHTRACSVLQVVGNCPRHHQVAVANYSARMQLPTTCYTLYVLKALSCYLIVSWIVRDVPYCF